MMFEGKSFDGFTGENCPSFFAVLDAVANDFLRRWTRNLLRCARNFRQLPAFLLHLLLPRLGQFCPPDVVTFALARSQIGRLPPRCRIGDGVSLAILNRFAFLLPAVHHRLNLLAAFRESVEHFGSYPASSN
jgi:hypothetical protein